MDSKEQIAHIQRLTCDAYLRTGRLAAMLDGAPQSPEWTQRTLEETMEAFEMGVLELRQLCEAQCPGAGGYGKRTTLPALEVSGKVERPEAYWVKITLNTLLPHCRYQTPNWLKDTIHRLLKQHEAMYGELPCYDRAMMVIEEYSNIQSRRIFDQDNKGWKSVSNAIKGWLIPDDDQYTLSVSLLSTKSERNVTEITLLPLEDTSDYFAKHAKRRSNLL